MKVELINLHLIQGVLEASHPSTIESIIVFIDRLVDEVEIPANEEWVSACAADTSELA
jgi:hypothetical protein